MGQWALAMLFWFRLMLLTRLLNACHRYPGFVYERARLCERSKRIEIDVRPRRGCKPICSGCYRPGRSYDRLAERRFEFIPFWGFWCFCCIACGGSTASCGVVVEEVPWGMGKHNDQAYMLFLAHWARKLSWKETAEEFRTSWDKVHDAVEYVVTWGLEHRALGAIRAIGVDEIQYGKGHKYLTLVYQIDLGCTRLLWIGKERTVNPSREFFALIGPQFGRRSSSSARTCGSRIWG